MNSNNITISSIEEQSLYRFELLPLFKSDTLDLVNQNLFPKSSCSKKISSGICKHANNCYKCRMFRPSINYMNLYTKQLRDAENNIAIAELHGYDRIKELNITHRDNILEIIKRVEEDNAKIEK